MDIGTAYLNADMEREVLMRVQPSLAKVLVEIDASKYVVESDGSIVVRLNKALYGCLESARLWFEHLSATLTGLGFVANPKEPCVFNLDRNGHQFTVCIYVDDLFCSSKEEADLDWLARALRDKYNELTDNRGDVHSYLGQTFDFSKVGEVKVTMEGYIRELLDQFGVTGFRATPATDALFDVSDDSAALCAKRAESYRSWTMRLPYLSQRVRPDTLVAVRFLSTRSTKSTEEDWSKLERVVMYLNSTASLGIVLRANRELRVVASVDASFGVHNDMKSHTGAVFTLGDGPIYVASKKQGLMAKSSTEAELVAVSDALPQLVWTRDFLVGQGYKLEASTLYQDNMSTIALANKGKSTSARTRHIAIRYFFVKDRIDSGEIRVEHMPTGSMIADILTKPLQGDLFRAMRAALLGTD